MELKTTTTTTNQMELSERVLIQHSKGPRCESKVQTATTSTKQKQHNYSFIPISVFFCNCTISPIKG